MEELKWDDPPNLSKKEYVYALDNFFKKSRALGDDWLWVGSSSAEFLKSGKIPYVAKYNVVHDLNSDNDDRCWFRMEYHVIYSISYRVPVIYFLAYWPDSSLLSQEEIFKALCEISEDDEQLKEIKNVPFGGGISQTDHPVLGIPFYYVHPCNTASLLEAVLEADVTKDAHNYANLKTYLATYLSFFGPSIGLTIETGFFLSDSETAK